MRLNKIASTGNSFTTNDFGRDSQHPVAK